MIDQGEVTTHQGAEGVGVDEGLAAEGGAAGPDDVLVHLALEHVPGGTRRDRLEEVLLTVIHGQHEDRKFAPTSDLAGGLQTGEARHRDVENGEIELLVDPELQGLSSAVLIKRYDETIPAQEPDAEEPREQLIEPLRQALDSGALSDQDRDLLLDLALAANLAGAQLRRGRAGLTTPSVAQLVRQDHALAARTIRRHAADALDVLAEVARRSGFAI